MAAPGMDVSNARRNVLPSVTPYPLSNGSATIFAWFFDMMILVRALIHPDLCNS